MQRALSLVAIAFLTSSWLGKAGQESTIPPSHPPASEPNPAEQDLFNKDQWTIFGNIDFLLWTVNESALDYAIKMRDPAWSATSTYAVGDYKNATFNWDPGVRVSIGYFNAPKYWDLSGQYTFLHAVAENKAFAPTEADTFLNGTWIGPDYNLTSSASPLRKAESHIDFYYNVADALFTRRFHPNPHFRLNLFGGATLACIHQTWNVHYTNENEQHSKIRNKWSFTGAGPRVGVRLDWFIRCDFYLTGVVSSAILSGKYRNKASQNTDASIPGADSSVPFRDTHFHDVRLVYTGQMLLGPSWQKTFTNIRTELFAGYEFTVWNNLHEIYRSTMAGPTAGKDTYINDSNLSLQGLTVRWGIDF